MKWSKAKNQKTITETKARGMALVKIKIRGTKLMVGHRGESLLASQPTTGRHRFSQPKNQPNQASKEHTAFIITKKEERPEHHVCCLSLERLATKQTGQEVKYRTSLARIGDE